MNKKLIPFYLMICFLVAGFIYNIRDLNCVDTPTFNVACHQMWMSFGVLFCIGILLLTAAGLYILGEPPQNQNNENPAKNVFDSFAKQLIPVATLVLGYYFGNSASSNAMPPNTRIEHKAESSASEKSQISSPADKSPQK